LFRRFSPKFVVFCLDAVFNGTAKSSIFNNQQGISNFQLNSQIATEQPIFNIQYPVPPAPTSRENIQYPIKKNNSWKPGRPVSPKLTKNAVLAKPPCSRQEFLITNREQPIFAFGFSLIGWIFLVGYWIFVLKTKKSGLPGEAGGLRSRGKHLENALV